jgi:site-specific DNA-methyltransferase (adenine-specific)
MINLHNKDCMLALKEFKDNQFDLAIVDPPYGVNVTKMTLGNGKNKIYRGENEWDNKIPKKEYWDNLFRVSKNQIVWGANYMTTFLFPSMGWVYWDKGTGKNDFSDGELAFTSFKRALRSYKVSWVGANANNGTPRIHPTEKPTKLYEWLLMNYAKEGDKILDTHLGSGSIAIACHNLGFDLEGYELDKEYFEAASKRLEQHQQQIRMF